MEMCQKKARSSRNDEGLGEASRVNKWGLWYVVDAKRTLQEKTDSWKDNEKDK